MARSKSPKSLIPLPVRLLGWLFFVFFALVMVVLPVVTTILARRNGMSSEMLGVLEYVQVVQQWLLRLFVVAWIFFLGGSFASFLNVVAWRVPRGKSILGSSKCPFCNVSLPFTANLPVWGWLSSAGRCRKCKLPISPRYLVVEIILGLVFLAVGVMGLFCGGLYLAGRPIGKDWGIEGFALNPEIGLVQIVGFHLFVICIVFVMALVRLERKPIPWSIYLFGILGTLLFTVLWPWTQQVFWPTRVWPLDRTQPEFWMTLVMGLVGGAFSGVAIWLSYRNREGVYRDAMRESVFCLTVIGVAFGFQFALGVALGVLLLDAVMILLGDTRSDLFATQPVFKIGFMLVVLLLLWRATTQFDVWPGSNSTALNLFVVLGFEILLALGVGAVQVGSGSVEAK